MVGMVQLAVENTSDQLSSNTTKAFFQGQWCPDTTGLCGQEGVIIQVMNVP